MISKGKAVIFDCDEDGSQFIFRFENDTLKFIDSSRFGNNEEQNFYEFDKDEAMLLMLYLQEHLELK